MHLMDVFYDMDEKLHNYNKAVLIAISKKSGKVYCNNYRGINKLEIFSGKIFAYLMLKVLIAD